MPLRPVVDLGDLLLVQADGDELGQPAVVADHAQRAVAGVDQRDGGLDDPAQHDLQVQVAADGDHRLQQGVHPVPGGQDRLEPDLQLVQQLVEPQLGQQGGARIRLALQQESQVCITHRNVCPSPGPCGAIFISAARPRARWPRSLPEGPTSLSGGTPSSRS